jgi:hypothetical protein
LSANNANFTGTLTVGANTVIQGNLQVVGNILALDYTTANIANLNIILAANANTASQANGAGIIIAGANANIIYNSLSNSFTVSNPVTVTGNVQANNFVGNGQSLSGIFVTVTRRTGNVAVAVNV